MLQNPYDKACRYLVMLDPVGFLGWLLRLTRERFEFRGWLDTRAIVFPSESDRTSDLVAHLVTSSQPGVRWALPIEFQIEPDSEMFGRVLSFLAAIWRYVRPDAKRGSRFSVAAAVMNLTGRGSCSQQMLWPDADLVTQLGAVERDLEHEDAGDLLQGVESGAWPRSLLAWLPPMTHGDVPGIIDRWIVEAGREPDRRHRGDYAAIALLFADRVRRRAIWAEKLTGWNVTESAFINEFMALGEARGEARGRLQEARSWVLRIGSKRFGAPGAAVESKLEAIVDHGRLERIGYRIAEAADWSDLLATS